MVQDILRRRYQDELTKKTVHLVVSAGIIHHELEPVTIRKKRLELLLPGLVARVHARVVPGLLLLLRLIRNCEK